MSQQYTRGYAYKCGQCKKVSPEYKEEKGMRFWCRLHFKRNPKCKQHHHSHGLDKTMSNSLVTDDGQRHMTYSGRTGQATAWAIQNKTKSKGHNKHKIKMDLEDIKCANEYAMEAVQNDIYYNQVVEDLNRAKHMGCLFEKDIINKTIKNKNKKKKKKKKKNKKK